ncbi:MAG: Ser-Thr-rich GPI-anchored membrane family protein, partial [bacterium]
MKRLLQLFLAGVFLLSFSAQARVILPKGGEEWSVGSSVQLEWDASGESATIRLIRPDQEPIVIAEDIADTGHYLWPIKELEAARTYRIEITPSGGNAVQSRTFRIIAWDTKRYLGEFDEDDRSRVTHPLEAAVLDKDKDNRTVMVDWVDYRHFLKNNVRIYLHQVGKLGQLDLKTQVDNTGSHDWKLNNRSIKACSEGSCYFVIRSGRKRNHLITSHSFTLGDVGQEGGIEITEEAAVGPSEDSAAPGSVLTLGWTGPEGKTRIDLYQAGYYHQTIKEEVFPVDDEGESHLSWAIPATLPGGEDYTVVLTSLADGTKQATSTPVSIEAAEGDVAVTRPKNISLGRKSTRLGWKNTQGPVDIDLYLDGRRVKTIARNTSPTRV